MGYRDALTGLMSHTYFQLALRDRIVRVDQDNGSLCLAMLDLDNFRSFNETHGHLEGDQLLLWVADLLAGELQVGETAARFGGDEFVLLLNAESVGNMASRMEQLRGKVEQDPRPITVSIGIAIYPRDARDVVGLLKTLDDALYVAKRGGRNLVCVSKSYEERNVKPIRDDGDEGPGITARQGTPPSDLSGGGSVRLPD